jgi:selenocysteine lyase/cysteine desulfurase
MKEPATSYQLPATTGRRGFLVRTGIGLPAALLAPAAMGAARKQPSLATWSGVRAQFDLARDTTHMASMLFASHPRPVREAIARHRAGFDANPAHYLYDNRWDFEANVLTAAAAYLDVDPTEIALTDSTTMGLAMLYSGLRLNEGQEVLTTPHDHYSTRESLRLRAIRSGGSIREVALYRDIATVTQDEIVESVVKALRPKTRVLAVTWVHSATGLKLPVRRIADALARENAARDEGDRVLLCVDGVHGIGVEDVSLRDLGCDFFVAGCHKWLFGPRGTGFVWGRSEAWRSVVPTIPTFGGGMDGPGAVMTPGGFHSFEHRWALAEAFEFQTEIGRSRVSARVHELNERLKRGLAEMKHVRLRTPMSYDLSAGIVCFEVEGMSTFETVERLRERRVVGSVAPYASRYARLTPGLVNSEREVDRVLAEIRSMAGASGSPAPPRPPLEPS